MRDRALPSRHLYPTAGWSVVRTPVILPLLLGLLAGCGGGSSGSITPNKPPVLTPIADQAVIAGDPLSFGVSATDPDGPLPLSLKVKGVPAGASFIDRGDGTGAFSWTPDAVAVADDPYVVTFSAIDGAGLADTRTVAIAVLPANQPPVLAQIADQVVGVDELLTFSVVASDADGPPPLTLAVAGLPADATFTDQGDGTGTFSWTPAFADISGSPHVVVFTASDGNAPSLSSSLQVEINVSFSEEFDAGVERWVFVDDVPFSTASWVESNSTLQQLTKVESFSSFDGSYHRGTYAYLPSGDVLTDYRFSVDAVYLSTFQSNDIGVMFRYQDNDNYYRLSMNARYGFTRLEKKVGGNFVPLAVNGRGYTPGALLQLAVEARGSLISVWVDGDPVFAIEDDSLPSGTVALYTQDYSSFERAVLEPLSQVPAVILGAPVAYSVNASDSISASAAAPLAATGATVEFVVDDMLAVEDNTAPYSADFAPLSAGDYVVEAILRDAGGAELGRDTNVRVGVGGEYFVAIGDSITNGIGDLYARDNQSASGRVYSVQGYQAKLVDLLDASLQRPTMVYNSGIGGDTSFNAAFLRVDSILERHPGSQKALVILGTNDASTSIPSGLGCAADACAGTFKGNMQALVDSLNAAGKTVYIAHPPPAFGSNPPYSNPLNRSRNRRIQEYNEVIDNELSGANSGPELFSFFLSPAVNRLSLFRDGTHPNALGHLVIAHLWHDTLNPAAPVGLPFMLEGLGRSSQAPYLKQNLMQVGDVPYVDRSYRLTARPELLEDGVWISTADADSENTEDNYLSFDVARGVTVYVAYDADATLLPLWMDPFTDTGLLVGTDHPAAPSLRVYRRAYNAGTITLGGNMASGASGARAHYLVIIKPN